MKFQISVLKVEMNIVTNGPGDLTANQNINFDLYSTDYKQKQYNRPLLTGPAKHFF